MRWISRINEFQRARLTLTMWYVLICLALLILFNITAFQARQQAALATQPRFTLRTPFQIFLSPADIARINQEIEQYQQNRMDQIEREFRNKLLLFDTIVVILVGILGYVLSGVTLSPIARAMKEQEEFAADASHELRTPLSVISMEIETIKRTTTDIPQNMQKTLSSIQEEVDTMTKIVGGLLTLVRTDIPQTSGEKKQFDLSLLVQNSCEEMLNLAHNKKIELTWNVSENIQINAYEEEIKQVIRIILDNAIKYTPQNGHVTLNLEKEKNTTQLTVTDTGIGIEPSDHEKVFERFYRTREAQSQEGNGLGLAIAKKILERNNGSIKIDSMPQQGTTVTIYFK